MAKPPGAMVHDGRTVQFESGGGVTSGDAVSITGGQLTLSDADNMVGIVSDVVEDGHDAGDLIDVHVTGVVVANVQDGTAAGDPLGEPDTATAGHSAGELAPGDEFDAFSDEGGQFKQHDSSTASLDAGYAAVHLG